VLSGIRISAAEIASYPRSTAVVANFKLTRIMTPELIPRKNTRVFRIAVGVVGLALAGISTWMFISDRDFLLAALLGCAGLFALLDAAARKA